MIPKIKTIMSNIKKGRRVASAVSKPPRGVYPQVYTVGSAWKISKEAEPEAWVVYNRSNPTIGPTVYRVSPSTGSRSRDKDLVRTQFAKTNGLRSNQTNACKLSHYKSRFKKRG